jgi:hypothetical protein
MKNKHILPNTEVPIELRKEVYREALRIIEKDKKHNRYGLCLLLPKLLYGLDIDLFIDEQINDTYRPAFAKKMFPELNTFLNNGIYGNYTNQERINFLKTVI